MEKNNTFKLSKNELEGILRLVEAQRELAYHLQKFKEAQHQKVEELKHLTAKAQEVYNLKSHFRDKVFNSLTDEERKTINMMLQQKHIRV